MCRVVPQSNFPYVDHRLAALQRNAAIVPTLTVGEGARLNVEVVRDMVFPHPYRMPS